MRPALRRLSICLICLLAFQQGTARAQTVAATALPTAPEPNPIPDPGCNEYSMKTMPVPHDHLPGGFGMKQRTCYWRAQLFTASALFGSAFFAGIAQAQDDPVEWPQGADGFGRRMGTRYTQGLIKSTATFLVSAAVREDPRPKPQQLYAFSEGYNGHRLTQFGCRESVTVKGRLGQSLLRMVWDSCQEKTYRRPKPGRLAGSFASGFSTLMWAPASKDHVSDALAGSGSAFGGYVAESVFSEFAPDISRMVGHLFPTGKPHPKP